MIAHPTPKVAVKMLREAFEQRSSTIKTKDAYELLAHLWGFKDWATAAASLQVETPKVKAKPNYAVLPETVASWPRLVFANHGGMEDEPMYFYAAGELIRNSSKTYDWGSLAPQRDWSIINDDGYPSIEVPDFDHILKARGLRFHEVFVVETIACNIPCIDRYGFPAVANEREAGGFAEEELGWSYLASRDGSADVEVHARDRGDDGMVEYWVQAAVHPAVYEFLTNEFSPARLSFEKTCQTASIEELLGTKGAPWVFALQPLKEELQSLFKVLPNLTMVEFLERAEQRHPDYLYMHPSIQDVEKPMYGTLNSQFSDITGGEMLDKVRGALTKVRAALRADTK